MRKTTSNIKMSWKTDVNNNISRTQIQQASHNASTHQNELLFYYVTIANNSGTSCHTNI